MKKQLKNIITEWVRALRMGPTAIYLMGILLPLSDKWLGYAVLALFLEQLIRRTPIKKENILSQLTWRNSGLWLFLFYLMHILGLFYSENMKFGLVDVGMKSSFAILPLFFLLYPLKINWKAFYNSLIFGGIISIILNMLWSTVEYYAFGERDAFSGLVLSHFIHRGYWAVYLLLGLFVVFKEGIHSEKNMKTIKLNALLALILLIGVLFTNSRVGIIVAFILCLWVVFSLSLRYRKLWIFGSGFGFVVGIFLLSYQLLPNVAERVDKTIKEISFDEKEIKNKFPSSTAVRVMIWDSSLELIRENFWWGVGTGDIKEVLQERNRENGYIGAAFQKLNCHNQFLNTHLAVGFFGALFLLLSFVVLFIRYPNDINYTGRIGILMILFFALLPESMLERQAGIIPYALLLCMFTPYLNQSNTLEQNR